jgi:hypothetical protein
MIYDKKGQYNDDFPRLMCSSCKSKAKRIKAEKTRKEGSPDTFLKTNNITDKDIIKEFKAIYNRNTRRQYKSILKDAIEIVGYRKEELTLDK